MGDAENPQPSFFRRLLIDPFYVFPTARTLSDFYHQLAAMLHAGLPILRALETLEGRCSSGIIRRRIPRMRGHIEEGGNLGGAFALFRHVFDPVHIAMIAAAERAGRLTEVLEVLSEACKRRSRLGRKFIAGVIYPFFLLNFAFLVVPFVERIQGVEVSYWRLAWPRFAIFYGVVFVLFAAPRMMRQFRAAAYSLDAFKELVPVYAGVTEKLAVARLARAIDGLYSSGISLVEALPVAAGACGNELLRRKVDSVVPMIRDGEALSTAMRTVGDFPVAFLNMVATGEESGNISEMLSNTADYYDEEAETALNRMAIILPVVIYAGVAIYVGLQIVNAWSGLLRQRYEPVRELLNR